MNDFCHISLRNLMTLWEMIIAACMPQLKVTLLSRPLQPSE